MITYIVNNLKNILAVLIIVVTPLFIFAFRETPEDKAKYKIISKSGKVYYCQTFRVYGRGVIFDDIYNKSVIVMGDLQIEQNKSNEEVIK